MKKPFSAVTSDREWVRSRESLCARAMGVALLVVDYLDRLLLRARGR